MTTPDIFLSYNREDAAVAKRFADAFAREGLSVWWDTALRSGEAYDEVTEAALRGAKAVVVLWSPRSVVSRWVRAEATIADRCKTLVPVTIEACERPIMFELTQTAELSHWTGDAGDAAWLAFLDDVHRFVGREVEAPPAPSSEVPVAAAPTVQETLKPGQSGSAPSLAVLPFTNRSQLPEDEVFAEGMVEDVISALSQGVNVRVLGASATASLSRGAITDLAGIGRQLGVTYLLEGNVRRIGNALRVTTQLLEAATSEVIWSGRFDRPLTALAELQEDLVLEIAASLDAQVYGLEIERALRKPADLTAWEAMRRAESAYRKYDVADLELAIAEARRAVTIAPDFAPAHALLAAACAAYYQFSCPDDPTEVARLRAIAEHALALAPEDVIVLTYAGFTFSILGFPEEGLHFVERAVRKAPGYGLAHYALGLTCVMLRQRERALTHLTTAIRLRPGSHMNWLARGWEAAALIGLGRSREAIEAIDAGIALNPTYGQNYIVKALVLKVAGQQTEAIEAVRIAKRLGFDGILAERLLRRTGPNGSGAAVATIHGLYAAAEDVA